VLSPQDAAHDAKVRIFAVDPNVGTAYVLATPAGKARSRRPVMPGLDPGIHAFLSRAKT
jgi:hypothetical protein